MPSRLREMLTDAVLEAWPHDFTEAPRRPTAMVAPRHVKLAVEFIQGASGAVGEWCGFGAVE